MQEFFLTKKSSCSYFFCLFVLIHLLCLINIFLQLLKCFVSWYRQNDQVTTNGWQGGLISLWFLLGRCIRGSLCFVFVLFSLPPRRPHSGSLIPFNLWPWDFSVLQEAIIGGLQSETTYSVTVAAYTTKGDGARSKAKVITTTGAGLSQFVKHTCVCKSNYSTLRLKQLS